MRSNRTLLLVAAGCGLAATVLSLLYLSSATGDASGGEGEPQVEILFVANDLPANHALVPEVDLQTRLVGVESSPGLVQAAVKADEMESVRGKYLNEPVPAGMPLLYAHLASVDDLELAPGMRAIGISVDEQATLGGLLVPGDRVDVLVSYRIEDPTETDVMPSLNATDPTSIVGAMMGRFLKESMAPDRWQVEEVLTDVRVLAINDRLTLSRQQHLFGMETGLEGREGLGGSNVVTLQVTPEQAKKLIKAQAGGGNRITFVLRPQGGTARPRTAGS